MKIFDNLKNLTTQIKKIATLTKKLQAQQAIVSEKLIAAQAVQEDIQRDIEKMNFKNQPHLDRIQEKTTHLNAELAKFKAK
ncbi:hypothetical protein [Leuconostoc rapi]|uniref:hypothetical protein n=1 Tax=Leuconostoc rapi TaxID=1406906 RepID=UPI00195DF0E9|nr:hypothetical protein [Leuconostoc rapi]MBM7435843.1 DNA repair ATPase RecN [Leuconostoc rapi]